MRVWAVRIRGGAAAHVFKEGAELEPACESGLAAVLVAELTADWSAA
jgi:hypothetical protein